MASTLAPRFGQVVIGPPAAGKTSYCESMASHLRDLGIKVAIINCDPANDEVPYNCSASVRDLADVSQVMALHDLGPNGAMVKCMELLSRESEWLLNKLDQFKDHYLIFDFPGQSELYTHHSMVKDLLHTIQNSNVKLCAVYLVDAHHATDAGKYISALLQTLSTMIHLEIPFVNLFTKIDLIDKYNTIEMPLEFYTDVLDLEYLLNDSPFTKKYLKLNKAMAEVVTDSGLVSYVPISIEDKRTIHQALQAINKANGFAFGSGEERNIQKMLSCAVGAGFEHDRIGTVKDTYENNSFYRDEDSEEEALKAYATQNPNVK